MPTSLVTGGAGFIGAHVTADLLKMGHRVIVLDDLQWADPLSIRLLQHLLQHQRPARVLVIGTVRTTPSTDNPALDALLSDLRRDIMLKRIGLGGLAEDDVAALLGADGQEVAAARVAAVHRATRGNAFFVTELVHHGAGNGDGGPTLPASVRDVLTYANSLIRDGQFIAPDWNRSVIPHDLKAGQKGGK